MSGASGASSRLCSPHSIMLVAIETSLRTPGTEDSVILKECLREARIACSPIGFGTSNAFSHLCLRGTVNQDYLFMVQAVSLVPSLKKLE